MVFVVSRRTAVGLLWDGSSSSYSGESPSHNWRSSVCFIASPDGTGDDVYNVSGNNTNVDAISGCWDHMAEPWNNIDGRCACVGHRGIPSRRRECDVVLETGIKASDCLRNATRHTGAIQGNLRQPVLKSRSSRRPRMSSAEKPSTVGVEPRVVKGFRECCSVAHPGENVDVLAHDQRVQLLTTQPSLLARTVHATQLHLEATFAEATAQPFGVGTSQLPQDSLRFLVPSSHNIAIVEEAKSLLYTLGTAEDGNNQLVRVACLGPCLCGSTFLCKDCEIWAWSSGIYYHPSKLVDSSISGEIREAIPVLDTLAYHVSFVLVICNANEFGPFTSVHMAEKHKGFLTDFDKETIYSSVRSMVESSEFFRLFRKKLTVSSLREEQILGCFMIALKVSLAHSNGTLDTMLTNIKRDCEQNGECLDPTNYSVLYELRWLLDGGGSQRAAATKAQCDTSSGWPHCSSDLTTGPVDASLVA